MSRLIAALLLLACASAPAFSQDIPPRFRKSEGKLLKLQAAYGTPEMSGIAGSVWSGDGKTAVVATSVPSEKDDQPPRSSLVLIDVATGAAGNEIRPKEQIEGFAISHDGKNALIALSSGQQAGKPSFEMQWWDLKQGKAIRSLAKSERPRLALGLSPDSKIALLGDYDGNGELVDVESGKAVKKIDGRTTLGPFGPFGAAAFRPGHPQAIVFGEQSGDLIDLKSGAKIAKLPIPNGYRTNFSFSPSGKVAALLDGDGGSVWDLESKKSTSFKLPPSSAMLDLRLIDDRSALLLHSSDDQGTGVVLPGKVQRIDLTNGKIAWTAPIDVKPMSGIAIDADGKSAILGSGLPPFRKINLADGSVVSAWGGHGDAVTSVAAIGKSIVSTGSDGLLVRWGPKGSDKTLDLGGNGLRCQLAPRGDAPAAIGIGDGKIRLLDSGDKATILKGHEAAVTSLARAPKSDWFASASADRTLRTWDASGKAIDVFAGHSEAVNAVVISPDERWLISASDDGTVRFWPIVDGKLAPKGKAIVAEEHKRQVTCLALSEDGSKLASGSQDQTIRIWDMRTRVSKEIAGHKNWVNSVVFVGDRLASASDDLTIRLWDMSGKLLDTVDLASALDGPRTLAKGDDGSLIVGTSGWMVLQHALPK